MGFFPREMSLAPRNEQPGSDHRRRKKWACPPHLCGRTKREEIKWPTQRKPRELCRDLSESSSNSKRTARSAAWKYRLSEYQGCDYVSDSKETDSNLHSTEGIKLYQNLNFAIGKMQQPQNRYKC